MLKSINAEGIGEWSCTDCDYKSIHATTVKRHVESKHIGKSYVCDICQHLLSTQNALNMHLLRIHGIKDLF